MITTAGSIFHEIAVNVVHSDHGDFLKTFADAYLRADEENEKILRPTWFLLITKYGLDKECERTQGEMKPELFKKEPVKELVGISKIEEYEQIEEIKGSCPKCGGPLELRKYISLGPYVVLDSYYTPEHGYNIPPLEDTRDPYCPSCKLFWLGLEASK